VYDWEIVMGKRRRKWIMLLYFFCKWIMLFAVIAMVLVLNIDTPINCQALYSFAEFTGNSAIGAASTLLMLRTIAIWTRNLWVTVPLVILSLGQWGILFHGMTIVRAGFSPEAHSCVVISTGDANNLNLNLLYLYTMFVDLVVLVLSTIGLLLTPGRSTLWKLLFKDGVVFFLMAFWSNAAATVMLLLNLNPALNLIFSVPAACITASAASRSFIRLSTWAPPDVYLHQSVLVNSTHVGTNTKSSPTTQVSMAVWTRPTKSDIETGIDETGPTLDDYETKPNTRTVNFARPGQNGVMITMDTFSHANDETNRPVRSSTSSLEFDSSTPRESHFIEPSVPPPTHSYGSGRPNVGANF
jgi:hypothetical protein